MIFSRALPFSTLTLLKRRVKDLSVRRLRRMLCTAMLGRSPSALPPPYEHSIGFRPIPTAVRQIKPAAVKDLQNRFNHLNPHLSMFFASKTLAPRPFSPSETGSHQLNSAARWKALRSCAVGRVRWAATGGCQVVDSESEADLTAWWPTSHLGILTVLYSYRKYANRFWTKLNRGQASLAGWTYFWKILVTGLIRGTSKNSLTWQDSPLSYSVFDIGD